MKVKFKMTSSLLQEVRQDLARPHAFAAERVGFLSCGVTRSKGGIIVLASQYHSVADEDYLDDQSVGAMMAAAAIRKALQLAYGLKRSMVHVHSHEHQGRPWFSSDRSSREPQVHVGLLACPSRVPSWSARPEPRLGSRSLLGTGKP